MNSFLIKNIDEWNVFAAQLVTRLQPSMIVTLSGSLGVGKTTLVQAVARALGVKVNPRSPTFSLMRTYRTSDGSSIKRVLHVDAYRLEKSSDVLALDMDEELSEPGTVLFIEWPENLQVWMKKQTGPRLQITISIREDGAREVTMS